MKSLITSAMWRKALPICVVVLLVLIKPGYSFVKDSVAINHIYKAGEGGYACFRIPALITTKNDALLAFAEARKADCGDSGDIDLVVKRSDNGGKTWGAMQLVWSDSTNTCGNPVPIVDRTNGRIVLISTWNLGTDHEKDIIAGTSKDGRRVYVLQSDNQGKSWSKPREITSSVKMTNWTWYATGPCHGLQIENGQHKGRLVVPVNHIEAPSNKNFSHTIYSDDHGTTWKLGSNTPQDMMNETTLAEISGSRLMLNMRNANRSIRTRNTSTSTDGGQTWSNVRNDSVLVEPICQGSLLNFNIRKKPVLLFINPANKTKRMNLTLRMSYDNGQTWPISEIIYPGPSAYSDISIYKNKNVAVLYECGIAKPYEGIAFKVVSKFLNKL
ncbi:sialidase family protein [Mucilaginibacter sp. PAMB04274]|uniref:sialidase family protein n=1 Tax=Mucilaginibacter sp. PAMB04274 TaxID=3138568 RepID=UPI0031F603E5